MTAPTLAYGATVLTLPADLHWTDEHARPSVAQSLRRSITGALLREETALQAGRPITLAGAADAAWMDRGTLDTLRAWADLPGMRMTLVMRGIERSVGWDHGSGGPIAAEPLFIYREPATDDRYIVTLRFITVPS